MRKLILGTASIVALGIAGVTLNFPAGADNAVPKIASSKLPASGASHDTAATDPSKDDIRWAQLELRNIGLYGPQPRRRGYLFCGASRSSKTRLRSTPQA